MSDPVEHPRHYTSHPSGVECIEITRHFTFNVGNAIKYLWRAGLKDSADPLEDLRKARWYIGDELERLERERQALAGKENPPADGSAGALGSSLSGVKGYPGT